MAFSYPIKSFPSGAIRRICLFLCQCNNREVKKETHQIERKEETPGAQLDQGAKS